MAVRRPGQPGTRAAAVTLPRALHDGEPLRRYLPSRRSLVVGVALAAVVGAAYAAARETSAFAVGRIAVTGAPPQVRAQVRHSLAPLVGTSLLALDGGAVLRRIDSLPTVVSATYDRAFPHTLRVVVVPERPVAVLRRGRERWLVSARGRVVERLSARDDAPLPRIWVPTATPVTAGGFLAPSAGGAAARAVALVPDFAARIATATVRRDGLVLHLRSGLELRLGAATDVRLKVAIARRALPLLPPDAAYLDLRLPGRPVAGPANSQLSGGG